MVKFALLTLTENKLSGIFPKFSLLLETILQKILYFPLFEFLILSVKAFGIVRGVVKLLKVE